ncbi:MAG: hypothetical protein IKC58_06180 [Clostridia bacterium]|nr:hypothetical protein [Clostridia bacterium]MBR2986167.1 hypothetical protein [Clostridia bacterium]
MDENNKGTVVAVKYLAPELYSSLFVSLLIAFLSSVALYPEPEWTLGLVLGLAFYLVVIITLLKMIECWIRPTAVIKDFGDRFTVYYALGKTRTFRYDEVQEFVAIKFTRDNEAGVKHGALVFKSYGRTYRTGVIKYVETVRMVLNSKRPYYPKQQL